MIEITRRSTILAGLAAFMTLAAPAEPIETRPTGPLYDEDGTRIFEWRSKVGHSEGYCCVEILDRPRGLVRYWRMDGALAFTSKGEPFRVDPRYLQSR